MIVLAFFALFVAAPFFVLGMWGLICNERTYRQRMAMIDARPMDDHERFEDMYAAFHEVTYWQHKMALMKFQDPRKLYRAEAFND